MYFRHNPTTPTLRLPPRCEKLLFFISSPAARINVCLLFRALRSATAFSHLFFFSRQKLCTKHDIPPTPLTFFPPPHFFAPLLFWIKGQRKGKCRPRHSLSVFHGPEVAGREILGDRRSPPPSPPPSPHFYQIPPESRGCKDCGRPRLGGRRRKRGRCRQPQNPTPPLHTNMPPRLLPPRGPRVPSSSSKSEATREEREGGAKASSEKISVGAVLINGVLQCPSFRSGGKSKDSRGKYFDGLSFLLLRLRRDIRATCDRDRGTASAAQPLSSL